MWKFQRLCLYIYTHTLVANPCDAWEYLLDEFQEKKKKKKETSFLSWSSKKKCMKFIIKKKLKETAQNVIS